MPPLGAGTEIDICPVALLPPVTVLGVIVKDPALGDRTVIVVFAVTPDGNVALKVTFVSLPTPVVVTATVAVFVPEGTVTEAGILATDGLFDERVTTAPALGEVSVTVADVFEPPMTCDTAVAIDATLGDSTTIGARLNEPPGNVAWITTLVSVFTANVLTTNCADEEPAAIVTLLGGTATDGTLLDSVTVTFCEAGFDK